MAQTTGIAHNSYADTDHQLQLRDKQERLVNNQGIGYDQVLSQRANETLK